MIKIIITVILFLTTPLYAGNVTLYEDLLIDLPNGTSIKGKPKLFNKLPNNSIQSLLDYKNELFLNLPEEVVLIIGISDNAKTSKQMNGLSTLNWLTVVSTYINMIHKNVKKKQEQGYKTVSTVTGDWVGKYRAIISRLGWATEKGINNLFIADIFHEKAMISLKVTWISDGSDSEKIADQVISSISVFPLEL
jgi:hypothetical protein